MKLGNKAHSNLFNGTKTYKYGAGLPLQEIAKVKPEYVRWSKVSLLEYVYYRKTDFFSEHQFCYDIFSQSVIKERLEINYEIIRLTKLQLLLSEHTKLKELVLLENIRYTRVCI